MIQSSFTGLRNVLTQQLAALRSLLDLAYRENTALLKNDHEAFLATVREQERLVSRMDELEQLRVRRSAFLAEGLGLPAGATLGALSVALDGETARSARELHRELTEVAAELYEVNARNHTLVRNALAQTRHAISVLSSAQQDRSQYRRAPNMPVRVPLVAAVNCRA